MKVLIEIKAPIVINPGDFLVVNTDTESVFVLPKDIASKISQIGSSYKVDNSQNELKPAQQISDELNETSSIKNAGRKILKAVLDSGKEYCTAQDIPNSKNINPRSLSSLLNRARIKGYLTCKIDENGEPSQPLAYKLTTEGLAYMNTLSLTQNIVNLFIPIDGVKPSMMKREVVSRFPHESAKSISSTLDYLSDRGCLQKHGRHRNAKFQITEAGLQEYCME